VKGIAMCSSLTVIALLQSRPYQVASPLHQSSGQISILPSQARYGGLQPAMRRFYKEGRAHSPGRSCGDSVPEWTPRARVRAEHSLPSVPV
jgi:hypothetical protein